MIEFHSWSLNDENSKEKTLPNIHFHAIKYSDKSVYLWIGDSSSKLENMSCSLKTPYESEPIGIDLVLASNPEQNDKNDLSKDLSIKLAKRLNKQTIVSFNVAANLLDQFSLDSQPIDASFLGSASLGVDWKEENSSLVTLMQLIEKRLYKEIKSNPDKF